MFWNVSGTVLLRVKARCLNGIPGWKGQDLYGQMPPMFKHMRPAVLFLSLVLLFAAPIHKAESLDTGSFRETWILNGNPTERQFSKWKTTRGPGPVELRVLLNNHPNTNMLLLRSTFPLTGRIQVGFGLYPTADKIEIYKKMLAQGNIELISTSGQLPSPAQIDVLNQIAPSRVIFILGRYLNKDLHEEKIFQAAKFKYSLSFNLNRYPEFLQKFPIAELPRDVPIQIVADYWPRYVQMDVWNLIPQTEKRLRITEATLSPGNLPYLMNMKDLKEVIYQGDGDVMPIQWERLAQIPVRWIAQGAIPSEKSLRGFENSLRFGAPRKLVIDRDDPLSDAERTRLISSNLDVEWIHVAP